ncbi:MAG: cation transporter [Spirochaetales bacterium]|nr:cation transporter [Spirochaetales bacterium]
MRTLSRLLKSKSSAQLLNIAVLLSVITIGYNIIEGLISIFFGTQDETLALFGFGADSFVEVMSGIGILHMVIRIKRNAQSDRNRFERGALLITGISFMLLSGGLIIGSLLNIVYQHQPLTTVPGIIISLISLITMLFLYYTKLGTGNALDSKAIIADAKCTLTCFYLSGILLGSSVLYELFAIGYFDVIGSMGIAVFAFKEGWESITAFLQRKAVCNCAD